MIPSVYCFWTFYAFIFIQFNCRLSHDFQVQQFLYSYECDKLFVVILHWLFHSLCILYFVIIGNLTSLFSLPYQSVTSRQCKIIDMMSFWHYRTLYSHSLLQSNVQMSWWVSVEHKLTNYMHIHMSISYRWTRACWFKFSFFLCIVFLTRAGLFVVAS